LGSLSENEMCVRVIGTIGQKDRKHPQAHLRAARTDFRVGHREHDEVANRSAAIARAAISAVSGSASMLHNRRMELT